LEYFFDVGGSYFDLVNLEDDFSKAKSMAFFGVVFYLYGALFPGKV
jgi:hypothetical protein